MIKYTILKNYFGYTAFRHGQEELIDSILSGKDSLGIMPTGGGKSICYQIPAMCMPGITIVISPLISLMKDQVQALCQAGIPAAYINSSLTQAQTVKAISNARDGKYKIIYVAPERLDTYGFTDFAKNADISMLTVDEAHCISQWGQDFRPSYLKICEFLKVLKKRPVISAFTATATEAVRNDICSALELNNPCITVTGFDRPNLYFEVKHCTKKYDTLLPILRSMKGKSGIVYCATRKNTEQVCDKLIRDGIRATRYHAGLTDEERSKNQDDFLYDKVDIIVATNAFGMGIDKSNVGFVIHYNMPKDIESYYQEAGRAGRDGSPAECILLYSPGDVRTNQMLIQAENDKNPHIPPEIKERALERLKLMTFYCHTTECLRSYILKYFGEKYNLRCENCGNCSVEGVETDITEEAEIICTAVENLRFFFGRTMLTSILRGSKNVRITENNLDKNPAYGKLNKLSDKEVNDRINLLISKNILTVSQDKYGVISPGAEFIAYEKPITMKTIRSHKNEPKADTPSTSLFAKLKAKRMEIAKSLGVPAFVVFSDTTLTDMCKKLPKNEEEMIEVNGVGKTKLKRFGKDFLDIINQK